MKFFIGQMRVVFPYDYIYPEQLEYMTALKEGLDKKGHLVLEMPSGTGKTISLLSLLVAFLNHHADEKMKVVYCTRTVVEMTKTLEELKRLIHHWELEGETLKPIVALSLTARKNLCIEPEVSSLTYTQEVDAACRSLTASWSGDRCAFYDSVEGNNTRLPAGVHTLDDIRKYGREKGQCPYYLSRQAVEYADIIVHSYLYLADPKVSPAVTQYLSSNTIVVMDEGHNVDDVCIEAMSMVITKENASQARDGNLKELKNATEKMAATNRARLQDEYNKLVNGLAMANMATNDPTLHPPQLPADIANEAIPGNLRQATSFMQFLGRIADFIYKCISRMTHAQVSDPLTFLTKLKEETGIDLRHLRFTAERLRVLCNTLQITDSYRYRHVSLIADFVTVLATYYKDDRHEKPSFVVIFEPFDAQDPTVPDPVMRLTCVDASLAVKDVFTKFNSVVLTSGTLSPLDIYPKILGFTPTVSKTFPMTISRKCICPMIVTRSADQTTMSASDELSSSYTVRVDKAAQEAVTKSYAAFLLDLARTVPDGIVCFFTGYQYMSEIILQWDASGFLQELSQHKLIFIETQGVEETSVALTNYRRACDIGRGALFMSIARGKIAEGIDFDRHYGRAVVMFGVPFLPPTDRSLQERLRWMEACLQIPEGEFRNFDAIRQASQCIGRVLRNKTDYGVMALVDRRFALNDKRRKFPHWIQQCFKENTNLSTEAAVTVARSFFRELAQPWDREKDLGSTLLDYAGLTQRGLAAPQAEPHLEALAAAADKAVEGNALLDQIMEGKQGDDDDDDVVIAVPEDPSSTAKGKKSNAAGSTKTGSSRKRPRE